jgi:hypothetical protein
VIAKCFQDSATQRKSLRVMPNDFDRHSPDELIAARCGLSKQLPRARIVPRPKFTKRF